MAYPIADRFASFWGEGSKSQASCLLRLVRPYQFAVDFDSANVIQEPETDRSTSLNGSNTVYAESPFRDVQHGAAIIRFDIEIDEPFHGNPWSLAAFRPFHWQHQ